MKKFITFITTMIIVSFCMSSRDTQTEKSSANDAKSDNAGLPWYKTTYRWAQTNFTEIDPVQADLEFWRQQWRRTKIQGVIINCSGIVTYYSSELDQPYRAKFLGDQDFFKRVSDMANEEGIVVIARMDINRTYKDFFDANPDWFSRRKNGEPVTSGEWYFTCINSGYYKEFIPQVLTEIIEKYQVKGFADNSWKGIGRGQICYCDNCKKKFQTDRGLSLPEAVSWDDPVYREWIRWSSECQLENWILFNEVVRKVGGDDCLWVGMSPMGTIDLKDLKKHTKIMFSDHQSRGGSGFGENANYGTRVSMAFDEQIINAESMANYVRGTRTFRLAANPKEETRLWIISGIAGGISPWFHHIGGSQNDSRQFETPVPIFQWHANNEQYLYNRTDLANVAVVWSQPNSDFYGRNQARERVSLPLNGFCEALSRYRIPFLSVNMLDVGQYAHRIKTLILPEIAVMTDQEIDMVCDFVNKGGNIVVTGITATLDENGEPSGNDKLWKLLGLTRTGETKGIFGAMNTNWEFQPAHNYLRLPNDRHEILAGFENTTMIPFGGGLQVVNSTGNLKPLFSYIPPFPVYPPEFSWIREEEPDTYPMFAGTLPSGGRAVYFAGDIDRCYGRALLPDHGILLANAVEWASNGNLPFALEGPGHIDCKIYGQENRLIVHLTNLTGTNRAGYLDEFIPIGPFTVTLDVQGVKPKSAYMTVQQKKVPMKIQGDKIIINVDKITDFEMLVIE